ncbi:hypothetical protein MNB_SV-13-440 [hydrothermal vent metagenome]|uniref:Rod shape-determining protein MreD n=2 Tax=hydrothermal vent metagenome TaxID=652676 RepID=A0A1W1CZV3_9ZZZZ
MKHYLDIDKEKLTLLQKIFLVSFILFYPFLVSIYTMLPPLIGLVGYIIISNLDKNVLYAWGGFFYLANLELNLSLPLLLSFFIIIVIHSLFYSKLKLLIRCRVCFLFTLMVLIDFSYYLGLFLYDMIFNTSSIIGDMLLAYYIAVDILIGVFL